MSNRKSKQNSNSRLNARIGKTKKAPKLSEKAKKHHEKLWRLTKSGCI